MGERKVLNKYLPPDFDPEQLARGVRQIKKRERERKEASNYQIKVWAMWSCKHLYSRMFKCFASTRFFPSPQSVLQY